MTLLLFAINTETVHSSIETTCYLLCILFSAIAVISSLDIVLIEPANSTLSGDGSCLHIHASRYGHKVQGALESDNNYRFSAPDADIGLDSDLAQYFSVSLSTISLSTFRLYTLTCLFLSLWKKHLDMMLWPVFRLRLKC